MLAAGLIILGLSEPTKQYPDACTRGRDIIQDYLKMYPSCKLQTKAEMPWLYNCEGGYNYEPPGEVPPTTGMKYPGDRLVVMKILPPVGICSGAEGCPAYGTYEGNDFYVDTPGIFMKDYVHTDFDTYYKWKGYCYVSYKSFNSGVSNSYADSRFNVTSDDFLYYPQIPKGGGEYYEGYSEHVYFGCDDEEETKFNLTEAYLATDKTILPPASEHKCKKGARSFYYKYDPEDDEYFRLETTLTDFWGTVKKTTEEQGGIRTSKVKVGLSNKLSVAAGIGIAVAVSAVIVAVGCVIFYCVCKSKSAVKS